jgi:hypothetical protein
MIITMVYINISPDGMIFAGGDVYQPINPDWFKEKFGYTWSHWRGEGGYAVGMVFYSVLYITILSIGNLLSLSTSEQSLIYYVLYWGGPYFSFLFAAKILKSNNIYSDFEIKFLSFLYALNPYTFYIFFSIWGFNAFPFIYITIPIVIASSIKIFEECGDQKFKYTFILFIALFISNIGTSNLAFYLSLNIINLIIVSFISLLMPSISIKSYIKNLSIYFFILFTATSFVLIPQLNYFLFESSPINNKIFNFSDWVLWQRLDFWELFTINPEAKQFFAINKYILWAGSIFYLAVIFVLLKAKNNARTLALFLACLFSIAIESKLKGIITNDLTITLFSNPLLGSFRSNGKLFIYFPFLLIGIIYLGAIDLTKKSRLALFALLFVFNGISILPVTLGKIQTKYSTAFKPGENCDTSTNCNLKAIPQDYLAASKAIEIDGLQGKILSTPFSVINSPGWNNYPKWKHIGADPTHQLFSLPIVDMNSYEAFGTPYGEKWAKGDPNDFKDILRTASSLGISYIIFHKDVAPQFIEPSLSYIKALEKDGSIVKIHEGDYINTYRVKENYRKNLITQENTSGDSSNSLIEFVKINSTQYLAYIPFDNKTSLLVFREAFSSQWELLFNALNNSGDISKVEPTKWWNRFNLPAIPQTRHHLYEGYGNSWEVNPQEDCAKITSCQVLERNGKKFLVLMLEYKTQKIFYSCLLLSTLLFMIWMSVAALKKFRMNRYHFYRHFLA